jgi:hypothetical protein
MNIKMYGLPAPIALGASMGVASMISGVLKETVYENVLGDDSAEMVYSLTTPVLTGAVSVGIYRVLVGKVPMDSGAQMFVLGAMSEIAATYIDDNVLGNAIDLD